MDEFLNMSTEDLIDKLVWHNCAGRCNCNECIKVIAILNIRNNGGSHEDDTSGVCVR